MKATRLIATLMTILLLGTFLVSCAPSVEDVEGTYIGTYEYNGNEYTVAIILFDDGTYASATSKNGAKPSTQSGDFEIKWNKIVLYDVGPDGAWAEYKYSKGVLTNNNHKFYKEED